MVFCMCLSIILSNTYATVSIHHVLREFNYLSIFLKICSDVQKSRPFHRKLQVLHIESVAIHERGNPRIVEENEWDWQEFISVRHGELRLGFVLLQLHERSESLHSEWSTRYGVESFRKVSQVQDFALHVRELFPSFIV